MARGTIRQRSKVRKDSWTIQAYVGVDPKTGRKKYRSEAVKGTKAQAQRRLTELQREIDTGNLVERSRLTVGEYLEQWMRDYAESHVSKRTFDGYRGNLDRYLLPNLGAISLEKLTPRHVQDMESKLIRGGGTEGTPLSPRTVVQAHRVLSKALNDAVKLGIVGRNVAAAVEPPRATKYEAKTLDWTQAKAFVDQIVDSLQQALFLLAIQTGLRRSELLGLQWGDVDLSTKTLSVRRALVKLPSGGTELKVPKNGPGRVVDLPQESAETLKVHREGNGRNSGNGNFVFCHSDGSSIDPDLVSKWFRQTAMRRAGLTGVRLHDLRHTHASMMLSGGIHLKIISERLGHSSMSTIGDLYSHVLTSNTGEAVRLFESEWANGNGKFRPTGLKTL